MIRVLCAILASVLVVACDRSDRASVPAAGPPATGPGTVARAPDATGTRPAQAARSIMRFQRAVIVDPTGFEAPLAAATLFLPADWHAQGGVFWAREFLCTNGYNFNWTASSPDGAMSVGILPQVKWESNNYGARPSTPGCQSAPFTDVRAYLQAVARQWKPGARILDFRRRTDIEREFATYNQRTPMPLGEIRNWAEAGEMLLAFDERGTDMRGTVAAAVLFSLTVTDAGTGRMQALTGFALPGFAAAAPNGRLDFALFEAIRSSIKASPVWEARIANHNLQIGRVALEESRKRAALIAQSNAEIARIREEAWSAYQQSADRRAREFGKVLRGVETYADRDAPGGTVDLSHRYSNAWRINDGTYVLTNDASFEPWRDLGVEGRRLEVAQ